MVDPFYHSPNISWAMVKKITKLKKNQNVTKLKISLSDKTKQLKCDALKTQILTQIKKVFW